MKDKFRIVWMKIQFSNLILIVKPKSLIPSPQKSQTKVPIPRKPKSPKLQGFSVREAHTISPWAAVGPKNLI